MFSGCPTVWKLAPKKAVNPPQSSSEVESLFDGPSSVQRCQLEYGLRRLSEHGPVV